MRLNKIITFVVLALSFCVFDQIKDDLVKEMGASNTDHGTLIGSVDRIYDMIPRDFVRAEVIPRQEDRGDKCKSLVPVELGEKICNTILQLEF